MKKTIKKNDITVSNVELLQQVIDKERNKDALREKLKSFHENDIAETMDKLNEDTVRRLFSLMGIERSSQIIPYMENASNYLNEVDSEMVARYIEKMDADDAIDVLEGIDSLQKQEEIISLIKGHVLKDITLIKSYDENVIGSLMTTNFVTVGLSDSIKQAMKTVVALAHEYDNISTIYVLDDNKRYCGAIDLRKLIIARDYEKLSDIISRNYPTVQDIELVTDVYERIKNYAEDSIPVLTKAGNLIGVITMQDIVEIMVDEYEDDYAKFAGMTSEYVDDERLFVSMSKRLPWLILLLVLGAGVSSVIGTFDDVVAQIAIVVCFQSLILDMAGNVGTQSLAVTIRAITEGKQDLREAYRLVFHEFKVGFLNGLFLGIVSLIFVIGYLVLFKHQVLLMAFRVGMCVSVSMMIAIQAASVVGTIIPIIFERVNVDPAVASGPLITTINDLVAVLIYYGLAGLLLIG